MPIRALSTIPRKASIPTKSLFHVSDISFASTERPTERFCPLCDLVGHRTSHTHNLDKCYSNPKNPQHQAWSIRLRYNAIVDKKLTMPECMKEYAKEQEECWDAKKR